MTTPTKKFTPNEDSGVRVKPSDLLNTLLVIEVVSYTDAFKTRFSPEGKPAVRLNVASVESGKVAPNQMWSNGAIVDSLRPYVGDTIVCRLEQKASASSGYRYLTVAAVSDDEQARGDEFLSGNPDLFNVTAEPAAEAGHW